MTKAWYECVVLDDEDNLINIDCLVDTYAEKDPYGTGDSPTMYTTDVVRAEFEGNPIALDKHQEDAVIDQVIEQLADGVVE
jgi:hypothetical protein